MAGKGGVRSTSFQPKWKLGETKAIRVPAVLADQFVVIAKELDETQSVDIKAEIILTALNRYIEAQQQESGANQHRRKGEPLNIEESRDWKHFVKFMKEIEIGDKSV